MTMPNLDQTEGVWIGRTSNQGYHYVQAMLPGNTPREQWDMHRGAAKPNGGVESV